MGGGVSSAFFSLPPSKIFFCHGITMEEEIRMLTDLLGDPIQAREWYFIRNKNNAVRSEKHDSTRAEEVLCGKYSDRTPFWFHYARQGGKTNASIVRGRAWL